MELFAKSAFLGHFLDTGSVIVSTLHTRETHHILIPFFKICIAIIPRYMLWVFSNILNQKGHQIAKLIAEYTTEDLMSAVVSYINLKEVACKMVSLSESHWVLSFCDCICVQRYWVDCTTSSVSSFAYFTCFSNFIISGTNTDIYKR